MAQLLSGFTISWTLYICGAYVLEKELVPHEMATTYRFRDDEYFFVNLTNSYKFLGNFYSSIYINGNGLITMNEGSRARTLTCNALNWTVPYIAAFIGDSATDSDDTMYSLRSQEFTFSLNSIPFINVAHDIKKSFPDFNETPEKMFAITWKNIPYIYDKSKRNTFQSIIVASRTATFLVLYYNKIEWCGNSAGVAISHGHTYYKVPGSCTRAMQNIAGMSNIGSPGKFVYKVDSYIDHPKNPCVPTFTTPLSIDFKPRVVPLVGSIQLVATGITICLYFKVMVVTCLFQEKNGIDSTSLPGRIVPENIAIVCPTPHRFKSLGVVRVIVKVRFSVYTEIITEGYIVVSMPQSPKSGASRESVGYFTATWSNGLQDAFSSHICTKVLGANTTLPKTVDIHLLQLRSSTWSTFHTIWKVANNGNIRLKVPLNSTNLGMGPTYYVVSISSKCENGEIQSLTQLVQDIDATTVAIGNWKPQQVINKTCLDRYNRERSLKLVEMSCPPSIEVATHDWMYERKEPESYTFLRRMSVDSNISVQCEYNSFGKLLTKIGSDTHIIYNSQATNIWKYYTDEFMMKATCCILQTSESNLCTKTYMEKRQISDNYAFPIPFKLTGAGYVSTIYGQEYMVSSIGAFWLLVSGKLKWQVLTQALTSPFQNAAVGVVGFVLEADKHIRFQVLAVSEGLQIWMNEQPVNFYRTNTPYYYEYMSENFTIHEELVRVVVVGSNSVLFSFHNGFSVKISTSQSKRAINILGSVSEQLPQTIGGLFGNYSGMDIRDGLTLDLESALHFLEDWRVSQYDLLFWFPDTNFTQSLKLSAGNKHRTYTPGKFHAISMTQRPLDCKNYTECIIDYGLTRNIEFARSSAKVCSEYKTMLHLHKRYRGNFEKQLNETNLQSEYFLLHYVIASLLAMTFLIFLLVLITFCCRARANRNRNAQRPLPKRPDAADTYVLETIHGKRDICQDNYYEALDRF